MQEKPYKMTVKIITDSLGDIPAEYLKKYDITVIPICVLFGTESYRDGVDMTTAQFYERLVSSKVHPTTAVPALGAFIEAYEKVAKEADEILVLTISHKLSGTFETASRATEMIKAKKRIKVIDSLHVIMAEGMLALQAAKAAQAGAKLDEIADQAQKNISRCEERMAFDTLEYLKRGGRIGTARAFLGSILKVNPVLGLHDGEVHPISRERSRTKALESLYNFALSYKNVDSIAVEDATTPDEADALAQRLKLKFPNKPIYRSKVSAVLGVHMGPNVISVSVLGDK
jgi:DegV family protein with EDD domain